MKQEISNWTRFTCLWSTTTPTHEWPADTRRILSLRSISVGKIALSISSRHSLPVRTSRLSSTVPLRFHKRIVLPDAEKEDNVERGRRWSGRGGGFSDFTLLCRDLKPRNIFLNTLFCDDLVLKVSRWSTGVTIFGSSLGDLAERWYDKGSGAPWYSACTGIGRSE